MEKQDILKAILSKDAGRLAEAKAAIKEILNARAGKFREDSTKFIAKSLFESAQIDESVKAIIANHQSDHAQEDAIEGGHVSSVHKDRLMALHKHLLKAGFHHSEGDLMHTYSKVSSEGHEQVAIHKKVDAKNDRHDIHTRVDHHRITFKTERDED